MGGALVGRLVATPGPWTSLLVRPSRRPRRPIAGVEALPSLLDRSTTSFFLHIVAPLGVLTY